MGGASSKKSTKESKESIESVLKKAQIAYWLALYNAESYLKDIEKNGIQTKDERTLKEANNALWSVLNSSKFIQNTEAIQRFANFISQNSLIAVEKKDGSFGEEGMFTRKGPAGPTAMQIIPERFNILRQHAQEKLMLLDMYVEPIQNNATYRVDRPSNFPNVGDTYNLSKVNGTYTVPKPNNNTYSLVNPFVDGATYSISGSARAEIEIKHTKNLEKMFVRPETLSSGTYTQEDEDDIMKHFDFLDNYEIKSDRLAKEQRRDRLAKEQRRIAAADDYRETKPKFREIDQHINGVFLNKCNFLSIKEEAEIDRAFIVDGIARKVCQNTCKSLNSKGYEKFIENKIEILRTLYRYNLSEKDVNNISKIIDTEYPNIIQHCKTLPKERVNFEGNNIVGKLANIMQKSTDSLDNSFGNDRLQKTIIPALAKSVVSMALTEIKIQRDHNTYVGTGV